MTLRIIFQSLDIDMNGFEMIKNNNDHSQMESKY